MRTLIAGHSGLVGRAVGNVLLEDGQYDLIPVNRPRIDYRDQEKTFKLLKDEKPDIVVLAAAKVGGIYSNNTYPADFIYDNLAIQNNIIQGSFLAGVQKLLFLGSSCIYPKFASQPMSESCLMTGSLEPTNEPYAIAKIAGIKMCESYFRQYGVDYRSVMPTNLYGKYDHFFDKNSHVIPSLISKFHSARKSRSDKVEIWGSGAVRREFMYSEDMADACRFILQLPKEDYWQESRIRSSHVNIGVGGDVTIKQVAEMIAEVTGYQGALEFNRDQPDGPPQKLLNSDWLYKKGWRPRVSLPEGLRRTYEWFCERY